MTLTAFCIPLTLYLTKRLALKKKIWNSSNQLLLILDIHIPKEFKTRQIKRLDLMVKKLTSYSQPLLTQDIHIPNGFKMKFSRSMLSPCRIKRSISFSHQQEITTETAAIEGTVDTTHSIWRELPVSTRQTSIKEAKKTITALSTVRKRTWTILIRILASKNSLPSTGKLQTAQAVPSTEARQLCCIPKRTQSTTKS